MVKVEQLQMSFRVLLLLVFVFSFILIFVPFFMPILIAIFVAFGLEPIIRKIKLKTKRRTYLAAGILSFLFLAVFIPIIIVLIRVVNEIKKLSVDSIQSSHLFQSIFNLLAKLQVYGQQFIDTIGLDPDTIPSKESIFSKAGPFIVEKTTAAFSSLPNLGLAIFIFLCMLFIFITQAGKIKNTFIKSKLLPEDEINQIISIVKSSCNMILVSTLLIGGLQATIVAIGSSIFGHNEFFLIFVTTFVLSFIPVIGAAPVAVFLSIISFLNGDNGDGAGLLVVAAIAGSIDNIIKPYVFSSEDEGLHPIISLLGIIGAIVVFGLPGLLLGPFIMQISVRLTPLMVKKLIR